MINKLCLIIGIVPILILYVVKCFENKYWFTVPISIIVVTAFAMVAIFVAYAIFSHIGWIPKNF